MTVKQPAKYVALFERIILSFIQYEPELIGLFHAW